MIATFTDSLLSHTCRIGAVAIFFAGVFTAKLSFSQLNFKDQFKVDSLQHEMYGTNNAKIKIEILLKLAQTLHEDSAAYLGHLNEALQIADHNNLDKEASIVLYKLGWRHLRYGNHLPKVLFTKSLEKSKKINNTIGIGNALKGLGVYYYDKGDLGLSITYYEKALQQFREAGFLPGVGASFNNIGISYLRMGDAVGALENHFRGLSIREKYDQKSVPQSLFNIGNTFMDIERYHESEYYFAKALELLSKSNNTNLKAQIYLSLAIIKNKMNEHIKSLEFATQALTRYQINNDSEGVAHSNILLGSIHLKNRSSDSARHFLATAKSLLSGTNFVRPKLEWTIKYAQYLQEVDSIPKSRDILQECLANSDKKGLLLVKLDALIGLYYLEKASGNYEISLSYLEKFKALEDSLFSLELQNKIDLIASRTESENLDIEAPQSPQYYRYFYLSLITISIVIGIYLLHRFYLKQRMTNQIFLKL